MVEMEWDDRNEMERNGMKKSGMERNETERHGKGRSKMERVGSDGIERYEDTWIGTVEMEWDGKKCRDMECWTIPSD